MALVFSDVLTRCQNALRIPSTNTEQATRLAALINEVYRDVRAKARWAWDVKRQVLNTVAPYTTDTVSVASGSASGTFATAPAAGLGSFDDRTLVVTANVTDPQQAYRIDAHTAGGAAFTLDAAYTGDTQTAAAFHVYQDRYDLATDCDAVRFVKAGQGNLTPYGPEELEDRKAGSSREGQPEAFSVFDYETTGLPSSPKQLVLAPYPDATYRLEVFYEQDPATELSGSDALLLPNAWVNVLIYGTLSRAYPILHNDLERGTYYLTLFNDLLALMAARNRETLDAPRIQPRDAYRGFYRGRGRAGRVSLGTAFGRLPEEP